MRDPSDILKGRVEMKVNEAAFKARSGARSKAMKAGKKAASAGKSKKKWKIWPFGAKEGGAEALACPQCSKEVDPSWEICPYCRAPLNQEDPVAVAGAAPAKAGPISGNKTVAIDLSELGPAARRLVGWIVVMEGSQKGQDFRLFEGKNSVGAGADSDVVLTDDYLSTRHAVIRFDDGRYELVDADSTNGSFVNEKRITKEELVDNDTIRFGRTQLRFKALY